MTTSAPSSVTACRLSASRVSLKSCCTEPMALSDSLMERMEASGQRLSGLELDDPETAKVVRIVDGETVVTDGPYAETKELVGGLMTVECADLDEAIELAASIPLASRGSVEIRPIDE